MKSTTNKFLSVMIMSITTIICSTPFISCSQSSKEVSLDGKSYTVITMEKGKPESGELSTMIFSKGMFDNESCHIWGFTSTTYTATKNGEAYQFEAIMQSPTEGTETFTGTITGDKLEGEMVWHKNGQNDIVYTFTTENFKVVSLDGQTFISSMQEGDSVMTEEIYFVDGKFESPVCYQWGFAASPYQAWEMNGKIMWQSVYSSDKEGMMYFYGCVTNTSIICNNLWIKEGQDNILETSNGTLKQ